MRLLLLSVFLLKLLSDSSHATQVMGLQSPYSFLADPSGKSYFISNVNGEPEARDNNGFITKLDGAGKIVTLKFIAGGDGSVELHAPKGMAIVDQILYVADLDTLRGFNKNTGKSLVTISLTGQRKGQIALTDVAENGQGLLYLSDQAGNTIYGIDAAHQHSISVLVHDERLAGPSSLAVHPKTGHIIVVSWNKGRILDITPEGALTELVSNGFFTSRFDNLSGVDFDRWGNMYVSDQTKGKIWRITPDKRFQVIAEYLLAPADIGIDRGNNLILVPYQHAHAAEINGLELPSELKDKTQKRTLADYGFVPPPPKPAPEAPIHR